MSFAHQRSLAALLAVFALAATVTGCSAFAPALDFPLLEVEEAGTVTDPGTELGLDDVAWVETTLNYVDEGDITNTIGISLRALEPLTADDWPDLVDNPEDFDGYTPVVLIVEQRIFGEVPEGYRPQTVEVFPIYEDGEVAPFVVVDFALGYVDQDATCGHALYDNRGFDPIFQYCLIGAAEAGDIVGMRYDGQRASAFTADETTPYWADPIFWRP